MVDGLIVRELGRMGPNANFAEAKVRDDVMSLMGSQLWTGTCFWRLLETSCHSEQHANSDLIVAPQQHELKGPHSSEVSNYF
jgi:hypothetical protein